MKQLHSDEDTAALRNQQFLQKSQLIKGRFFGMLKKYVV